MMPYSNQYYYSGFTLIEMIVVIVISGIIAISITNIIVHPVEGYNDLQRRAELVDSAEMTLQKIARDIRRALPNSIRTDASTTTIDMINTLDAGIYRFFPPPGSADNLLEFGYDDGSFSGDDHFTLYGKMKQISLPFSSDSVQLVINSINTNDIYSQGDDNTRSSSTENYVITPPGITVSIDNSTDSIITLSSPVFLTPFSSTTPELSTSIQGRRVFLTNGGITYKCESNKINRYSEHALSSTIGNSGTIGTSNTLSAHVDCTNTSFTFNPGSPLRGALATLKITLSDQGETITLLQQVHVGNTP
ncbi:MAG: prepilin-type N-terminal cleavage/methylation domain-containing protein [Gammaproteobacteria bacterium]|nr:prepilin-type N-terminal cleavage/methylation domain-containing protein [Gammaproteobacteria bacterium]MCP3853096.1 prepilin-type N-terminal cleavage/methylation domain-containing protein [Gammaproteobacteria bacterium]